MTAADAPTEHAGILRTARELDLDLDRFAADLDAPEMAQWLAEDRDLATQVGHSGGPMLFVDGRMNAGAINEAALVEALECPLGRRIQEAGTDFFHWAAAGGLVLILATLAALTVANSGMFPAYEVLQDSVLWLGWNDARFGLTLQHWINHGLMTMFFLIVGTRWEAPRKRATPPAAAVNGTSLAISALTLDLFNGYPQRYQMVTLPRSCPLPDMSGLSLADDEDSGCRRRSRGRGVPDSRA